MIFTVKQDIFSGIGHYLPSFVRASQVALGVKKAPAYAVDVRDTGLIPVSEELLEEGMATSSNTKPYNQDLDYVTKTRTGAL